MRRLPVAELVVLAAALSALAVSLLATALLLLYRWHQVGRSNSQQSSAPSQLPAVPEPPLRRPSPKKPRRSALRQLLRLLLCSRRRTRVEPANDSAAQGQQQQQHGHDEDVATWRDRWFGPATSRALYTIDEESGGESDQEPETPYYTPPASPPRLCSSGHSPPEATP
ncbi:hypothetical protein GUJ93_ZPchr0001g30984 [Zizania palustris]|uniref:Uncharacterized protein n=1 Tax=Zizania palustris TaxID=103762 RepID=A0A8J5VMS8_ZIZPA|nr:hypothetical protein GUJ93_ZPchr0001g30984 [Zizania palustris]